MFKKSVTLFLLTNTINAFAHCPLSFKPENACMMLDQNIIYVYDVKAEHNGPYKDLKDSSITSVKASGETFKIDRIARGVYKIISSKELKSIDLEILNNKKTINLKLAEK